MKFLRLSIIIVALLSFLSLSAFSNANEFDIKVGDKYVHCFENEDKQEVLNRLNKIDEKENDYTERKLEDMFKNGSIKFFAVNKYDSSELRVSVYSDGVSEKIQDMSIRSDREIKEYANNLVADTDLDYNIYSSDSKKYIRISKIENDVGGEYLSTQFITICNGNIYNISFYNDGNEFKDEFYDILNTFEIKEDNEISKLPIYIIGGIAVGIAVLITVIVVMIIGLIKQKRKE